MALTAQTQDLANLAKGDYLGFNAIFDQKENLYGYVAVYGYGKSGEKTKKFEYVLLDKNLNPVANKQFDGAITAADYYAYLDFRGKIMLIPSQFDYQAVKTKDFFAPYSMEIDLKTNTVARRLHYNYDGKKFTAHEDDNTFREEKKLDKAEKKEKGYNYLAYEYLIKEGGWLVSEMDDYGPYVKNNSLIRFDEKQKELWRFKYNENGNKKSKEILSIIEKDENHIYGFLYNYDKKDIQVASIVIDIKTGKQLHKKDITDLMNSNSFQAILKYGNLKNDKTFDDKIVTVGRLYEENDYLQLGFVRLIFDKKTFAVTVEKTLFKEDLKAFIPKIDKHGGVEGAYSLVAKDFFFLKDGSVGLLMEKYKPQGQYSASKSTDLVYIFTDKDFKVKGVKTFDKEKTKWFHSDYLFSQYINDGNDLVFFYRDNQKDEKTNEKNWILFINTLINGEFKQEQVTISSKDEFFVNPYVAKEGFILLQEFNKKEKYNKIRLERLNY